MRDDSFIQHASAVSVSGNGLLAIGPAGAGKSTLCLMLMAMGGQLVADDRVRLWREGDAVLADAPDTLRGRVEARGVGILRAEPAGPTRLALVVDLGRTEDQRLPPCRTSELLGVRLPLVLGSDQPHFLAALRQYLIAGRADLDS